MSLKDRNNRILVFILLFCIMFVLVSLIIHQFLLFYYLVLIYWVILALLLGIPHIYTGVKELREARQNGERIPWQQNKNIIQGIAFGLPPLIEVVPHLGSGYHPGNSPWLILDIIWTILISIFLVPLLFIEIVLTVGSIRSFLNRTNSQAQDLQRLSTDEQVFKE